MLRTNFRLRKQREKRSAEGNNGGKSEAGLSYYTEMDEKSFVSLGGNRSQRRAVLLLRMAF